MAADARQPEQSEQPSPKPPSSLKRDYITRSRVFRELTAAGRSPSASVGQLRPVVTGTGFYEQALAFWVDLDDRSFRQPSDDELAELTAVAERKSDPTASPLDVAQASFDSEVDQLLQSTQVQLKQQEQQSQVLSVCCWSALTATCQIRASRVLTAVQTQRPADLAVNVVLAQYQDHMVSFGRWSRLILSRERPHRGLCQRRRLKVRSQAMIESGAIWRSRSPPRALPRRNRSRSNRNQSPNRQSRASQSKSATKCWPSAGQLA